MLFRKARLLINKTSNNNVCACMEITFPDRFGREHAVRRCENSSSLSNHLAPTEKALIGQHGPPFDNDSGPLGSSANLSNSSDCDCLPGPRPLLEALSARLHACCVRGEILPPFEINLDLASARYNSELLYPAAVRTAMTAENRRR